MFNDTTRKSITIPIPSDLHARLKIKSVQENTTMKAIVQTLIRKELEKDYKDPSKESGINLDDLDDFDKL